MEKPAYDIKPYHSYPQARSPLSQPTTIFGEIDRLFASFDHLWADDFIGFLDESKEIKEELFVEITLTQEEARDGGKVPVRIPFLTTCGRCRGTGRKSGLICGLCRGQGEEKSERQIRVTIPSGVRSGMKIRIPLEDPDLKRIDLVATLKVSG